MMAYIDGCVAEVERAVFRRALELLRLIVCVECRKFPELYEDNDAANLLYWMRLYSGRRFLNPVLDFERRAEAGDFLPVGPDEDADNLSFYRQPMTESRLADVREQCRLESRLWCGAPDASLDELWQNACQRARLEILGTECVITSVPYTMERAEERRLFKLKRYFRGGGDAYEPAIVPVFQGSGWLE